MTTVISSMLLAMSGPMVWIGFLYNTSSDRRPARRVSWKPFGTTISAAA